MTEESEDDDKDAMSALLKRSLDAEPAAPPKILPSVQKKLRERSGGKFYGDGWSTMQGWLHYLLIAAIMLLLAVLAYVAIGPLGLAR